MDSPDRPNQMPAVELNLYDGTVATRFLNSDPRADRADAALTDRLGPPEKPAVLTEGASNGRRSVRLLVIADTTPDLPANVHGFLARARIDAIVTAGDLLPTDLRKFSTVALPKLGVYGNHCNGRYLDESGFTNLHLQSVDVCELRMTGLEGCVRYKPGESDILYTQDEYSTMVAALRPADVLVTHCPPAGINDHDDAAHQGIIALRHWVDRHQPELLIHGHTYPNAPITQHGATRVEYVHGARIVEIGAPAGRP
ncbi:MAG: metallophosphoesterase [Mycobacterium sp.]|nr:metallophosphoesterase [Mycobacterium sp.]